MDGSNNVTGIETNPNSGFDLATYCKENYDSAVMTLAWIVKEHDETSRHQLLFGSIEMIPHYLGRQIGHKSRIKTFFSYKTYFTKYVINVADALKIYREAQKTGMVSIPGFDNLIHIIPEQYSDSNIVVLPNQDGTTFNGKLPFLQAAFRYDGAQANHIMFPQRPSELEEFISIPKVSEWLKDRMFWRLDEHLEYLASMNLVLPNPYFSHSATKLLHDDPASSKETVSLRVNHDCSGKNLKVIFSERSNGEYGSVREFSLQGSEITIPLQQMADEVGHTIVDEYGRILAHSGYNSFIRSISTHISIGAKGVLKKCLDGKGQIVTRSHYNPIVHSDPLIDSDEYRIRAKLTAIRVERELEEKARDQHLYFRKQAEAERFIRGKIIHMANESLLIVDPYFSLDTVKKFIEDVVNYNVEISVICTDKGWDKMTISAVEDGGKIKKELSKKDRYEELKKKINELRANGYKISITVVGERQLHDRFVCTDGIEAWMLGASLDKPTESLTAIAKLANAPGVLRELSDFEKAAAKTDFDKWVEKYET